MELVIMAAGMGSRFGGLKQIAPMGPNDEFIIDYSIYDALRSGFDKVVFVIKEENYDVFKETIGSRVEKHIPVEYAFQKLEDIPEWVEIPKDRIKPWGTAQAIYAARDVVKDNFIVINADDFYGREAFEAAADYLKNKKANEMGIVGYKVNNTLTENGSVKRGFIVQENGEFKELIESSMEKDEKGIKSTPLNGGDSFYIKEDDLVSMNMLAFDVSLFDLIKENMEKFFKENQNNLEKCEFLIPDILDIANKEGKAKISVIDTTAKWYGVTYKEDTDSVRNAIKKLVEEGKYPNNLWE